jgi:two-component system chemotaxis response regulator CheY
MGLAVEFVITDLVMDNGSGIDLTHKIRASSLPKINTLPILMLTSKADVKIVLESVKAGVNNYILKPWTQETLAKRIVEVCMKLKIIF